MSGNEPWRRYTLHTDSPVAYPLPIVLTADAHEQLRYDLRLDGLEEGGGLYGHLSDGELVIEAVVPAILPGRTSNSVEIDFEAIDQLERHFEHGPGWSWLGDWHTHTSPGPAVPSSTDCRAWIGRARASRVGRSEGLYAGLIISPPSGSSIRPTITGWVVELAEQGDHQIRQVEVIEEVRPTPLRSGVA